MHINTSDSYEYDLTNASYLPGGTFTALIGKISNNIIETNNYSDPLGKWNATHITYNEKLIVLINLYRIPDSSAKGSKTSLSQYNRKGGREQTARIYREKIFIEIREYLHQISSDKQIIITGDYNQSIGHDTVQEFFRMIGVKDVFE